MFSFPIPFHAFIFPLPPLETPDPNLVETDIGPTVARHLQARPHPAPSPSQLATGGTGAGAGATTYTTTVIDTERERYGKNMNATCQCGAVNFKTPLEKPLALYICHCHECRRQTGSAFGTSAIFPRFNLPSSELLSVYRLVSSVFFSCWCKGGRGGLTHILTYISSRPTGTGDTLNWFVLLLMSCHSGSDSKAIEENTDRPRTQLLLQAMRHAVDPRHDGIPPSHPLSHPQQP